VDDEEVDEIDDEISGSSNDEVSDIPCNGKMGPAVIDKG